MVSIAVEWPFSGDCEIIILSEEALGFMDEVMTELCWLFKEMDAA